MFILGKWLIPGLRGIWTNRLLVASIVLIIVVVTASYFLLIETIDRSTDIVLGMADRIVIRRGGDTMVLDDPGVAGRVLDMFNHVLDNVIGVDKRVYTDESLASIMSSSEYVEIILNKRYRLRIAGRDVEAGRIVLFLSGPLEGVLVVDQGFIETSLLKTHIWTSWRIDTSSGSYTGFRDLVYSIVSG
jgi:hypothetical protein